MIVLYRHPHGITLNPKEYLLDNNDVVESRKVLQFKSEEEARKYLSDHDINDAEAYGIHFEEG
tara:strand:+ start:583 stop:771 length:189 start_codon:yes stop_codon:yes gene_type:complete